MLVPFVCYYNQCSRLSQPLYFRLRVDNMTNNKKVCDGKIRDIDIRLAFVQRNIKFFERDGYEFVSEFGINGTNIIDLACFDFGNKRFYGFEIKSEQDNTKRLKDQLKAYVTFFQFVYVITHEKHLDKVMEIINSEVAFKGVGVIKVDSCLAFKEIKRASEMKPLYWLFIKNMTFDDLKAIGESVNIKRTGTKEQLASILRRHITIDVIYKGIQDKIKKFHTRICPVCGSKLYYKHGSNRGGTKYTCFKCGSTKPY